MTKRRTLLVLLPGEEEEEEGRKRDGWRKERRVRTENVKSPPTTLWIWIWFCYA